MKPISDNLQAHLAKFMQEVWNAGQFDQLDKYVAREYTILDDPGDPWNQQMLDHSAFIQRVMYSRNAFPDLRFDIQESIAGDQKIAVRWLMSGTHAGDLPQLPASGRQFSIGGMTFYYFRDQLLIGHRQAFDQIGFLAQINALGVLSQT